MPRKRKLPIPNKEVSEETEVPVRVKETHHVVKVLENAQVNEAFHNKYIKDLQEQYAMMGHDAFFAIFINCLKQLIPKEDTNEYANIGLKFMAKFATSFKSDDMHPLLEALFDWVLHTVSLVPIVRARLCQFINLLLNSLGSNASLDDSLFDEILKYMFDRLKDLFAPVRVQAIKALQRLQMPDDPDDSIVKIYTFHLASDPSSVVRQAVLTCLGRNIHTIPVILERLWDIDEKVRRHVYVHMSNYPVKTYKVAHRLTFLEQGLNDRSDSVRKIVTGVLIPQWLESYNKNYLAFLSGLKLDSSEVEIDRFRATARLALFEIFKTQKPEDLINALSLDSDEDCIYPKCIPFDKLTVESSLFWWALIVYFQQDERRSDYLEAIIPELSLFCNYVQKYNDTTNSEEKEQWDDLISQNILFSLIEILLTFDYGDEIGRQNLRSLAPHLLTTNPCNENIIKSLVKICEKLIPNSDDRLQVYVEVIRSLVDQDSLESALNFSDPNVIESLEKDPNLKVQVSSLKLKLYELKEEESKFVKSKDYAKVSQISEQISLCHEQLANLVRPLMTSGSNSLQQKRITKEVQIKALQLAFHGVSSRSVTKLNPAMCQLYTDFIRLKIESMEYDVRNWALKCGATFSLLYEQLAKDVFAALNRQFFDHHVIDVWTTSVGAMFQLIVRYGFSQFDEDTQGNETLEEKQKEKSKKSRTLYNAMEYLEDPEDDNSLEKGNVTVKGLIYLFGHFMDTCNDIHLMSALVDGFCLLILHGLYNDDKLVSRLILLYFNPATEPEVNQILSIFFETLTHQKKQECLETALIQTLTKIIEASSESSLHEVKIEAVLKFIISSTLPVHCKSGVNIHNNMATALLKWMNINATNRELLRVVSKEMLALEISDDNQIRTSLLELTDELLEMPMDSRTEKNLKSFKEIMQGNHTVEIEFSSVAPANRIDGELEEDPANDDDLKNLSDNDSSNINDEEKSIDGADDNNSVNNNTCVETEREKSPSENGSSVTDDQCVETSKVKSPIENGSSVTNDKCVETSKDKSLSENGLSEATDIITEIATAEKENEHSSDSSLDRSTNVRKRLSFPNDEVPSPTKIRHNASSEETENESTVQQIQVQVNVHNLPVSLPESNTPNLEMRRDRVRQHIIAQQQQNSPDIISVVTPQSVKRRGRPPKKMVAQTSSSNPSTNESGKRKIDSLNVSQSKGDFEDKSPKSKKSKSEVFSEDHESGGQEKDKLTIDETKNINENISSIERSTRQKRSAAINNSAIKKLTAKESKQSNDAPTDKKPKETKPIKKLLPSQIPTRLNKRSDRATANTQSRTLSPKQPSISTRSKRSSSTSALTKSSKSVPKIASTKTKSNRTPTESSLRTRDTSPRARKALFTSNSSPRHRSNTSEPPKRKINTMKKISSPRKDKVQASKITASLTNLQNSKHRTRRAITKEFMANNVMTRNRTSIDGVKLLEKIDTLTTLKRNSLTGPDLHNEKAPATTKARKIVPGKSSIPIRPRRLKT